MAEKKTTKAAATKATATKKAAPAKAAATTKKTTTAKKAAPAKEVAPVITVDNIGFKAGDVYQTLASNAKAMNAKEIAKAAKISETEVLLGAGWLMKEGKVKGENEKFVLA